MEAEMTSALHTNRDDVAGDGGTDAHHARLAMGGLLAVQGPGALDVRTGVLQGPGSTALVTGTPDTGPMTVAIAPHHWETTRGSANGPYLGVLPATVKVSIGAAPASGSRLDVVYVKQQDKTAGVPSPDTTSAPLYAVEPGPADGTKPPLPVGAEELATVKVEPTATRTDGAGVTITNTARQTVARGARIPVHDVDERNALGGPGVEVYRLDTGQVQLYPHTGATWQTTHDPALPSLADRPRGWVGSASSSTAGPSGIAGTEQMFDPVTFTAVSGRRYRITYDGVWIANTAEVTAQFTVRSAAGSSVTNTGALRRSRLFRSPPNVGNFIPVVLTAEVTGLTAGTTTIGVGARVALGSGTITIPGAADNTRGIIVEDIGPA
jgi:hypothetical protein